LAPNFLLQHTGYFRKIARLSMVNVLVMTAAVGLTFVAGLGVVGFLAVYASAFVTVAALLSSSPFAARCATPPDSGR
jgi:hypothetical protein